MEMRTYTSAQARQLLRVDAKTFLRWLHKAGIEPTVARRDNRIKLFTQKQIEQLAEEHERTIDFEALQQAEALPSAEERIEALEERVSDLQATLDEMKAKLDELSAGRTPYQQKAPPVRILHEGPVPGVVKALDFAAQHHVTEDAARAAFKRQKITTTKLEGQQSHYLTFEQQHKAIDYWEVHHTPNFIRCAECPHG